MNLNYAEPDARGIADFFKQQGKGLFKKVDIREIYNEQATVVDSRGMDFPLVIAK